MKTGDRVRYVGGIHSTWPERIGYEGTIIEEDSPGSTVWDSIKTVRFDLIPSISVRCYYSSLELIK